MLVIGLADSHKYDDPVQIRLPRDKANLENIKSSQEKKWTAKKMRVLFFITFYMIQAKTIASHTGRAWGGLEVNFLRELTQDSSVLVFLVLLVRNRVSLSIELRELCYFSSKRCLGF